METTKETTDYHIKGTLKEVTDEGYTFIMSAEVIDRDNEIVSLDGLNTDNFMINPVMLYQHSSLSPIGTWTKIWKSNGLMFGNAQITDVTPEAKEAKALVDAGVLKAISIGFKSNAQETQNVNGKNVLVHTKTELYEASLVSIPANQLSVRIKELNLKAGRVLSAKNEQKITLAHEHLTEVLSTLGEKEYNEFEISELETLAKEIEELKKTICEKDLIINNLEYNINKQILKNW
jgi:HK97 family phage prohead protease